MRGWGDQRKLPLAGLELKASERGGEPQRHLEAEALGPRPRGKHGHSMQAAVRERYRQSREKMVRNEVREVSKAAPWGSMGVHPKWAGLWQVICVCVAQLLSPAWLSVTPWTVARQAPLSVGFSRQEYWSGLLFPPPGDLPPPRDQTQSLASPALAGGVLTPAPPGEPVRICTKCLMSLPSQYIP